MEPLVGIILGSASDKKIAEKTAKVFDELNIRYEATVASAHRTPDDVERYTENAEKRGIRVIIAIAGLSAALPGVVAAKTILPVVGVPVDSGALQGMDALLSIAQMPPGVPVAAVGIDGGVNAAVITARILCLTDETIKQRLKQYQQKQASNVRDSRTALDPILSPPPSAFE